MAMPPYPVMCYVVGCQEKAVFKIASRWSDGVTHELKTYSLACEKCVELLFHAAREKRLACRLAPGESLDEPGIFQLSRGSRDRGLSRCDELEKQCGHVG